MNNVIYRYNGQVISEKQAAAFYTLSTDPYSGIEMFMQKSGINLCINFGDSEDRTIKTQSDNEDIF